MGMYTEFHFNARLKKDTPAEVITILRRMVNGPSPRGLLGILPEHELFTTKRWDYMLRCDSYYFAADTISTLRYDDIAKTHFLCIRCNLKNYNSEIEQFVDWIMPYIDTHEGDLLGFSRYEEFDDPQLIRYAPGRSGKEGERCRAGGRRTT